MVSKIMAALRVRCALTTVVLLLTGVGVNAAPPPFRLGAIVSTTGVMGVYGQGIRRGIEMAVEARGGKVDGREIQVIFDDDESKSQVAVQQTTRLLAGGVDTLFAPGSSGPTLAMMPLAADAKVPMLVSNAADDRITGTNKSRYTFRTSPPIGAEGIVVSSHLKTTYPGKKVYAIVSDVGVVRDSWKVVKDDIAKAGLQVEGEDFPTFGSKNWSVLVNKVAQSSTDVVVLMTAGSDSIGFLKQAHEVGLTPKVKVVGPVIMDDSIANAVGAGALGVVSLARYHARLDNPVSKQFAAAYVKKYGSEPDASAGEAYDSVAWWLDVVNRVGGTNREKWIDAFETDVRTQSLKGTKKMRGCDHQAEQIAILTVGAKTAQGYGTSILTTYPAEGVFPGCGR